MGGWFSSPTVSSGFLPIARGGLSSGAPKLLVIKAQDPLLFDEVMAIGHLVRSVRSAFTRHVGVPDVLLTMPLKFSNVLHREGGRLHGRSFDRWRRGRPGGICKNLVLIYFTFRVVFVSYGI